MLVLSLFNSMLFSQSLSCNGDVKLCSKRYNEVVYATTHNAYNYRQGPLNFKYPNQGFPMAQQLEEGVRGLMIDLHERRGKVVVYHSYAFLGYQPFEEIATAIQLFLKQHPHEVVTLILESYVDHALVEEVFTATGLAAYTFAKEPGEAWPTLATMVQNNQRLVVFTDNKSTPRAPWHHYVWDHCVETHFTAHDTSAFRCTPNRGQIHNDLFILNHFITTKTLGVGNYKQAKVVNALPYMLSRARKCADAMEKVPNFLTVDFYEVGDLMEVVNALNQ